MSIALASRESRRRARASFRERPKVISDRGRVSQKAQKSSRYSLGARRASSDRAETALPKLTKMTSAARQSYRSCAQIRRVADGFVRVIASGWPMDASEIDVLVQRLVANPHDQEALAYAHNAGNADPKSYAVFLEKVGNATPDPGYASHWLSEAANVWSITLGDAHRAARVLMQAVDKDPTQETAAERLAQ